MALVLLLSAAIASLALANPANWKNLRGSIRVDGSSTVLPISAALAEEFKRVAPNVNVTVGRSGTGGGFKKFTVGDTDISNASRPISVEEVQKAADQRVEFIELPVAYDGLSIVVNKSNTWVTSLTMDEVKKIFQDGGVKTWNEVRPEWPDSPIKVYSPGTDSGTFDYFREVVVGSKGAIRSDMSVSEDDNVLVRGVEGDPAAIGFFGCAYYFEHKAKLRVVPIDGGKGPVEPTHDTIESGAYAPFSRPLLIYVNRKAADRPEVRAFIEFSLEQAGAIAEEVKYVKLPDEVYERAKANFAARKTGTQFLDEQGHKRIGPVTEVYK